jgi:hypothetical protein
MGVGGQRHAPAASLPEETRYPLYRRLGGPTVPVWTGVENLAPTRIRSPDHQARNESLYRLSNSVPHSFVQLRIINKLYTEENREKWWTWCRDCSTNLNNSYCCLCILIVRPCILIVRPCILIVRPCILIVVYVFLLFVRVFLLLSMYSYCSSMYSYCCLCFLIFVYVFLDAATLTEGFPCSFLGCKTNARV